MGCRVGSGGGVTWWRERSRKDEWTGSAEEDGGSTGGATGMRVKKKRVCNEGDREVNSHTETELS